MVPNHQHPNDEPAPTREQVLALVEVADTGGHWYWNGDVVQLGIDPWPVFRTEHGIWHVVRLFLPVEPHTRLRHVNACGLRTCVNPEHWRLVSFGGEAVLTNFDGRGWLRVS